MKIVLSPAKKLDLKSKYPNYDYSVPVFIEDAAQLIEVLKHKSPEEIKKMMKLSDNLANLNWERYQNWTKFHTTDTARPAIFTFNGNVYDGLDIKNFNEADLFKANDKIRILSGLYGVLRPFDLIYPYRLEMGTKLQFDGFTNLYDFWRNKITNYLDKDLKKGEVLVNLASQEYFKAIDKNNFSHPVIDVVFKDYKDGDLKTISIYAKNARGMMSRFIIQNNIDKPEDLKLFNMGGYQFDENLSEDNKLVFTR
jgi:cytoplasmic iron level regulating protein YaaA (DUF328/UPF0246 family)